jgi:hypothetical protein
MKNAGAAVEDAWRESAAFDVTPEDYRRAFALAIASEGGRDPSFRAVFLRRAWTWWQWALGLAILGGALWVAYQYSDDEPLRGTAWEALVIAGKVTLLMTPAALVLAAADAARASGWRRRFAAEQAAWKRSTRMRVRWNETAFMRTGAQGFGSFAWTGLHAWLDAPHALVVFTAMHDPIPIPHGALAPDDLVNLRALLRAAEVPEAWTALSAQQRGLRRVFR